MANTTFSGPVTSTNGFVGDIVVPTYTVANAPSAASAVRRYSLCLFQTAQQAQQFWLSLTEQTGSVLTQVPQSQQLKEVGYE